MAGYIFIASFIASIMLIGSMLKEKRTAYNNVLLIGTALAAIWLACESIPQFFEDTGVTASCYQFKLLISIILTTVIFWFAIIYSGYLNNWKRHLIILIIPIMNILSWATNSFPFAFMSNFEVKYKGPIPNISFHVETGFYVYMISSYTLILLSIGILIYRAARGPKDFRRQTMKVVVTLVFVLIGSGFTMWSVSGISRWENTAGDMSSIFMFVFFALMHMMSSRSSLNYEDRIMQMSMAEALRNKEFHFVLQPQYKWNGNQYEMIGAEALIRWFKDGEVYKRPDQFIPVAERNGMINAIGKWVVDEIYRINALLFEKGVSIKLSINVSSLQLKGQSFVAHLEKIREVYKDIPIDLVIEITESIVLDYETDVAINLEKIQEMGIKIALDDFGTGYSSLSYLKKLPIDYLKIDKTFIDDVHTDSKSLTPYILDIAKNLQLETIVEGTELIEQVEVLKGHCDYFQGYYFSKPLEEAKFFENVNVIS